jgi:hypothetical protein
MKELIKESIRHQLNDCLIEPMEYIEYIKVIDRLTNEQVAKVGKAILNRYPKAIANIQSKIQSLQRAKTLNPANGHKIDNSIKQLRQQQAQYRIKATQWAIKSKSI